MAYFKKKFLLVLLFSLLINFCVSFLVTKEVSASSVSVDNYVATYESEEVIINTYEQAETTFLVWADNYIEQHGGIDSTDSGVQNILSLLIRIRDGYYIIFDRSIGSSQTDGSINIIVYSKEKAQQVAGNLITSDWKSYNVDWTYTGVPGFNVNGVSWYKLNVNGSFTLVSSSTSGYFFLPRAVYLKYDNTLNDFINKYIPGSNIPTQTVTVVNMDNVINALDDLKDKTDETNEYLKSEDTSGVDYSTPQPEVSDITESGFSTIFTKFYNNITSTSSGTSIILPIPFTNKNITIPSNYTSNILNNHIGGVLKTLIQTIWYYLVAVYIVKDIAKIVQSIKDGSIMSKTDTNIKTEML